MPKSGSQRATEFLLEVAAQRLAKGESQTAVYLSLYPHSKPLKPSSLSSQASRFAHKLSSRVKDIQAEAKKDCVFTIKRKREILEDIAEGRLKVKEDGSATFRDRISAIDIDNKIEKVYDAGAGDQPLIIILREAPRIGTVEKPAIDAETVAKSVANSTPPVLNP